jgi:hypothetical protein
VNAAFLTAFHALPPGAFTGRAHGRRYRVTRHSYVNGRSHKLIAHELGGPDYISLNLYELQAGARLKPCEMPKAKVVAFVLALVPEGQVTHQTRDETPG